MARRKSQKQISIEKKYDLVRDALRKQIERLKSQGYETPKLPFRPKRKTEGSIRKLLGIKANLMNLSTRVDKSGKRYTAKEARKKERSERAKESWKKRKANVESKPTPKTPVPDKQQAQEKEPEDIPSMAMAIEERIEDILLTMEHTWEYGEECANGVNWKWVKEGTGARADYEEWKARTSQEKKAEIYESFSEAELERCLLFQRYGSDAVDSFTNEHLFSKLLTSVGVAAHKGDITKALEFKEGADLL